MGRELGLINEQHWASFVTKREAIEAEITRLKNTWASPANEQVQQVNTILQQPLTKDQSAFQLLKRPELDYQTLMQVFPPAVEDTKVAEQVAIQATYAGYIERQQQEIEKQRRYENTRIPAGFVYKDISGLSAEVQEKLTKIQPETIGMAARIAGVTPAAISLLLIYLKKQHHLNDVKTAI
jgi:tRNA uridine 5-carboxymethylaminomethyl modification enzyme